MRITRGTLKTCKSCASSRVNQKGIKADTFNDQVYHDIATAKESNKYKKLGQKTAWHIMADVTVNLKQSTFFVYKSNIPKNMCAHMKQEKAHGHLIKIS